MPVPATRSRRVEATIGLWTATAMAALVSLSMAARADVASDKAAAILVFPKLLVDASNAPAGPRGQVDTLIRVSNTSAQPISMRCFYVDATPQCPDVTALRSCLSNPLNCLGVCNSHWQEIDFVVNITARQPIAWLVSQGATECNSYTPPGVPCLALTSQHPGLNGQSNQYSNIPPAPQDPFIGELKCVAVDLNDVPVERNDLKGEVEITRVRGNTVDVEGYNAIGISAIPGAVNSDNVLVLGGNVCSGGANAGSLCSKAADCPNGSCVSVGEYNGCPNVLILDHFFDGAADPITGQQVTTDLTLVPCSEDLSTQNPFNIPVQFLVFNEFEQRLSTGLTISCFDERPIWSIASPDPQKSIFSAGAQGTLTGQTRIQGVAGQEPAFGHALLGIAEEFREGGGSAAVNLHFSGGRPQSDYLYLPASP
jgi:hypothetical protein